MKKFILGTMMRVSGHCKSLRKFGWGLSALVAFAVVGWILFRPAQRKADVRGAEPQVPSVAVAKVVREDLNVEVNVPAEFRPFSEVELHAKVAGFVDQINVDFGDAVKRGQLIAMLEVPELKDELDRARAAEKRSEADYKDAHLVYTRLLTVNHDHPDLVAQQDLDTAEAKDATTEAALAAARAEAEKDQTLLSYTRITAPFDGVITKRYADPGALIQAGIASETQTMPLVRISDNYHLRLDFPVPVSYVKDIHLGDAIEARVDSLGGKVFPGKISRCSQRVDESTRTMTTEMDVDNPKLELVPGMYATVVLKIEKRPHAIAIPTEAISAGKKTVYVINAKDEVEERTVQLGLETPTRYEVLSGLKEGELVLIGNPGQIKPGQKVEPKFVGLLAAQ